jgi:hypothetical protein
MLLLLLFLPLAMFGSVVPGNQFIPAEAPPGFGKVKGDFTIPEYNEKNEPGIPGGLALEDINEIKKLLREKKARLFFPSGQSIDYFLRYVIKGDDIKNKDLKNLYKKLIEENFKKSDSENYKLEPVIDQNSIPDTFSNHLLYALHFASTVADIDDADIFFRKTIAAFKLDSREVPDLSGKQEYPDTVLNRLKRVFIFEWKTLGIPRKKYSIEQESEFQQNKFYIELIEWSFIGALVFLFPYLGYKIKNFLNSKTSLFK